VLKAQRPLAGLPGPDPCPLALVLIYSFRLFSVCFPARALLKLCESFRWVGYAGSGSDIFSRPACPGIGWGVRYWGRTFGAVVEGRLSLGGESGLWRERPPQARPDPGLGIG
jgi:hypothetical protein